MHKLVYRHISKLKRILLQEPIIYSINARWKGWYQFRRFQQEQIFYEQHARRQGFLSCLRSGKWVQERLHERITTRKIYTTPKAKGTLHIFWVYSVTNWEIILSLVLRSFGKVTEFEWRSRGFDDRSPDWVVHRDRMNEAILAAFYEAHTEQPVDAVVGYLSGYNTDPRVLKKMREAGAVIFNFCWDDKLGFRGKKMGGRWTGPAALASVVDLNLTNAPDSCIKYAAEGGLAMFWPEAAHPDIHKPYDVPFEFNVSFVGGKYGWRPKFIKRLQRRGINVECFGNGWENGPLSNEEMVKIYSLSRINLGFAGVGHSKKLMCLKGRDFEVPMSGGLYLTQDNPELSLVYDVGKEIMTYKDEEDCAKKIKWLLANPDEADKIRKAGRTRAMRDHTWEKRFQEIFSMAGLLKVSGSEGTE